MVKKILLSLLIVILLSACSFLQFLPQSLTGGDAGEADEPVLISDSDTPEAAQDNSETSAEGFSEDIPPIPDANPLKLTIAIDQALAVEAEIGPEGGTIQVTTGDGFQFILEIPAGALLSPELIRMIPLTTIDGIPVEVDQTLGVKLEPEGIVFLSPVLLRIQHAPTDGERVSVGFGTMGDGEDFHLQTSQTSEGESRLYLSHFSNYGVIQARREEINRLNTLYSPSTAQNYAIDQTMSILNLVDDPAAQLDAFEKIMKQWFYSSIITRIENAAIFDDRLDAAVGEYLAWHQMIENFDLIFDFEGELAERLSSEVQIALENLAKAFVNAFNRAHSRCVQENNPEEAFRMHRYGLVVSHLNLWGRNGLDEADAKSKLASCFRFEFVFRSKVEGSAEGKKKVSQVLARIPLTYEETSDFDISGAITTSNGDLNFEVNTLSNLPDYCQLTGENGKMGVGLITKLNYSLYEPWGIDEVKIMLIFSEAPMEYVNCTTQAGSTSSQLPWWRPLFQMVNQPFFDGAWMELILFKVNRGEVFAEEELYGEIPGIPNSEERTKYELIHKPGQ